MATMRFEVELDYTRNQCSQKTIVDETAYVLAIFLEDYCHYVGRPKIAKVRTYLNGELVREETHENAAPW